jgi:hypothetical protein
MAEFMNDGCAKRHAKAHIRASEWAGCGRTWNNGRGNLSGVDTNASSAESVGEFAIREVAERMV